LKREWDEFSKEELILLCNQIGSLLDHNDQSVARLYCGESQVGKIRKHLGKRATVPKTGYQWVYPRRYLKV